MSQLNSACFSIRSLESVLSKDTLRMVYFSYIYSIIIKIFRIKKSNRIVSNSRTRDSCRNLFKKMKILSLCSQYIHTVSLYTVNKNIYTQRIWRFITLILHTSLHPPISNLTKLWKGLITLD